MCGSRHCCRLGPALLSVLPSLPTSAGALRRRPPGSQTFRSKIVNVVARTIPCIECSTRDGSPSTSYESSNRISRLAPGLCWHWHRRRGHPSVYRSTSSRQAGGQAGRLERSPHHPGTPTVIGYGSGTRGLRSTPRSSRSLAITRARITRSRSRVMVDAIQSMYVGSR